MQVLQGFGETKKKEEYLRTASVKTESLSNELHLYALSHYRYYKCKPFKDLKTFMYNKTPLN